MTDPGQFIFERDRHALVCAVLVSQGHWDQASERAQIVLNLSAAIQRIAAETATGAPQEGTPAA
jgi:hypothetical protein